MRGNRKKRVSLDTSKIECLDLTSKGDVFPPWRPTVQFERAPVKKVRKYPRWGQCLLSVRGCIVLLKSVLG
jgi:hypothetical protein